MPYFHQIKFPPYEGAFYDLKMCRRLELIKISKIAFSNYVLGLITPAESGRTRLIKCKMSKIDVPY